MQTDYGLPSLAGVLPARAIAIRHHGFADRFRMLFLGIILGLVSIGTVVTVWPGLYSDFRIKRDPVEMPDASLARSNCRKRKMSVNCEADIAYPRGGKTQIRSVDFSFMSLSRGDYESTVVAERGNPDNITLSLAIDKLWNRFLGSAAIVVLLGGAAILMLRRYLHLSTTLKAFKEPSVLEPVWARITMRTKKRWGKMRVTYFPIFGMKKGMGIVTVFGKNEVAWMHHDQAHDETFALAVRHPSAILPVMLDEAFGRLDLTEQESRTAQAFRDNLFAG